MENGFPPGVLMIDDNWQQNYGQWGFKPDKFSSAMAMIRRLHHRQKIQRLQAHSAGILCPAFGVGDLGGFAQEGHCGQCPQVDCVGMLVFGNSRQQFRLGQAEDSRRPPTGQVYYFWVYYFWAEFHPRDLGNNNLL